MNSWERFDEKHLPPIDKFYSNLNLKDTSKDDYRHVQRVWSIFNIKNLGEYHDLYVQSDTTQLADIFEQFRTVCLRVYKLDPAYFCTTPGLAMEACLKMTNVKIELLEKGLRGGISQAIHRYATANNKYMPSYDSQQLSPFLILNAKNEFEKDFFKLMNNSVFGKTMGNVRGRRDVKLIVTEKRRKKLVSKPNYD